MDIYISLFLLILFGAGLLITLSQTYAKNNPKSYLGRKLNRADPTKIFAYTLLCFVAILFVTTFRSPENGMSVDYLRYLDMSNQIHTEGISTSMQSSEIQVEYGLAALMYVAAAITPETLIAFIAISTSIALLAYFYRFKKDSPRMWLSIFLLLSIGSYFVIFNGIAQATAVAITFLASAYIYKQPRTIKSFLKYAVIILMAALVHKTALVMIPMYFILTYRPSMKISGFIMRITLIASALMSLLYLDDIVTLGVNNFFPEYQVHLEAGDISWLQAGTAIALVRPALFGIFLFVNKRYVNPKNTLDIVAINSVLIFSFINILSLQTQVLQRFSYYFLPIVLIYIPILLQRMPRRRSLAWTAGVITASLIFGVASLYVSGDMIFEFIWQYN